MSIFDFISTEAGQRRRRDLEDAITYYIPPELRGLLGLAAEANPVVSMERAGQDAQALFAPDQGIMDRLAAGGRMASNMAGVVAPAAVAGRAGVPAAAAVMEGLLGGSPTQQAAADMARGFVVDEYGGLKLFRGDTGSAERITGGIGEGLLFGTPYEDVARLYGDNISQFELQDGARVLTEGSKEFAQITGRKRGPLLRNLRPGENLTGAANDAIEKARAAGYDAVEFNSMRDMGVAVLNPSIVRSAPTDPAIAQAEEVLSLIRSGRADEVTEEMLAMDDPVQYARMSQHLWNNYDLPMDFESRMARAKAFDADLLHGTAGEDYVAMREGGPSLPVDRAIWASTTADGGPNFIAVSRMESAGQDSGRVLPLMARTGSNLTVDAAGRHAVDVRGIRSAADEGYDSVTLQNVREFGSPDLTTSVAIFDPRNIRSRFARFDPRLAHLKNLNASVAGALGIGGLLSLPQEEQY